MSKQLQFIFILEIQTLKFNIRKFEKFMCILFLIESFCESVMPKKRIAHVSFNNRYLQAVEN